VTFRITDNDSGTTTPNVSANHSASGQGTGIATVRLIEGSVNDGVWKATLSFDIDSAPGEWSVSLFSLEDIAGNTGSFGPGPGSFWLLTHGV